jgi:alpha-D-ribose 1-methylphosphonate 5-triphosphate synthase subunit PhnH
MSSQSPSTTATSTKSATSAPLMQLGFIEPVANSQQCFRALLDAFGQPAIPVEINLLLPDFGLPPSAIASVLTLADADTTLWVSPGVSDALRAYLRFHTGVRFVNDPSAANFALAQSPAALAPLDRFHPGTAMSPETSTTLIVAVEDFTSGHQVQLDGPGFEHPRNFSPAGFDAALWEQLATNHQQFPTGIDLLLCCETQVAGLPRSTRIQTSPSTDRIVRTPLLDAARSFPSPTTNVQER